MKKSKVLLACIFVFNFVLTANLFSQEDEARGALLKGKTILALGVNKWDSDLMLQARALFERVLQDEKLAKYAHYYVAYADYRLTTYNSLNDDTEKAKEYINDAIMHLEKAIQKDKKFAEAFALLSSCYGQKVGFNPAYAMMLGPKSGQMVEQAMKLAPENPRAVMLFGLGKYFTPEMFGGSKEIAMKSLKDAASLFEKWQADNDLEPTWGGDEVYAWIGQLHLDKGESKLAKQAFEKALKINPDYGWVKHTLMPKVSGGGSE